MSRSVRLAAKANSIAVLASATDEQLRQATELLRNAEDAGPRGTTWLQIGRAYLELGDFAASHRALDQARKQLKDNPALELFSAILALDENNVDQARQHLDELKRICPHNQALPTAQALCFLLQRKPQEALKLLRSSRSKGDSYDLTVSPLLISRLAAVVEEMVLPCELPPRELAVPPTDCTPACTGDEETDIAKPNDNVAPPKTDVTAPTANAMPLETDATTPNADAVMPTDNATLPETSAKKPTDGGTDPTGHATVSGIADPQAFAQELESLLPPLPTGVTLGGFSMQRGGTERLQRSWELPVPERIPQFTLAVHELLHSFKRSPKAYQAAFCLAEGLLALAEYGHERLERYGAQQMAWVRCAERLLREALICDKDIAFASHYLARTQLLQYRFAEAEKLWRQALAEFEKLPEAQYGLGQALIMSGRRREGRLCIAQAVSADMHLLRERLSDLARISK